MIVWVTNIPVMGNLYNRILVNLTEVCTGLSEHHIESKIKLYIYSGIENYTVKFYIQQPEFNRQVIIRFQSEDHDNFNLQIGYLVYLNETYTWVNDIRLWFPTVYKLIGELVKLYPDACK